MRLKTLVAPVKSSLNSISQQLSALPKEIQTIVEASIAVAALQAPANAKDSKAPSMSPAPAPDNDLPIAETAIDGHETKAKEAIEVAKEIPTTSKTVPAGRSQGKKTGASLLRKVSLGLAGMAGASPGHPVIRVGGPRKMGTTRLFGHPPATAPPADARDRWRADRQQVAEGAPPAGTDLPGGSAPPMADPQAPLLDALEGLQEELKTGGDEENEDRQTIIALG